MQIFPKEQKLSARNGQKNQTKREKERYGRTHIKENRKVWECVHVQANFSRHKAELKLKENSKFILQLGMIQCKQSFFT